MCQRKGRKERRKDGKMSQFEGVTSEETYDHSHNDVIAVIGCNAAMHEGCTIVTEQKRDLRGKNDN
jgi:hypothetical protein